MTHLSEADPVAGSSIDLRKTFAEIVVIDDDAAVRDTIVAMVGRLGPVTVGIDPESDIMATIARLRPSAIILDLSLGRRDAVQVLQGLAEAKYGGRILLISGRDQGILSSVSAIGARSGLTMLPSLTKPVRSKDLAAALASAHLPGRAEPPMVRFDLAEAVAQGWLEVWYQPKINLSTHKLAGAEALIRLRHPQFGIIPPLAFIPSASAGAYEAMTGFVIESVARDWSVLDGLGMPMTLSVNASIKMIERPCFLDMVRDAWPSANRPRLMVEVTEDEVVTDIQAAHDIATQLKLYDVDMSIDDFGSGYSSFASLRDLPFTELKLDRSFVTGCGADKKLMAFCQATAALARQFEVQSVAEGIETQEDLAAVRAAGFDVGQGYFFARPAPLPDFIAMIADKRIGGMNQPIALAS